MGENMVY